MNRFEEYMKTDCYKLQQKNFSNKEGNYTIIMQCFNAIEMVCLGEKDSISLYDKEMMKKAFFTFSLTFKMMKAMVDAVKQFRGSDFFLEGLHDIYHSVEFPPSICENTISGEIAFKAWCIYKNENVHDYMTEFENEFGGLNYNTDVSYLEIAQMMDNINT